MPGSVDVGVDAQGLRPISIDEFVRQADDTMLHAEERILAIVDNLLANALYYTERDGAARWRKRKRDSGAAEREKQWAPTMGDLAPDVPAP